jgi:cytochrome P450
VLQAAFHKPRVEAWFPLYHRQAQALARRWLAAAHAGRPVDVSAAVGTTTLEAVLEAVLSEDLHRFDDAAGRSPFHLVCEERQRDLAFAVRFRALSEPIRAVIDERRRAQRFPPDLLSHCLLARASDGEPMSDRQLVDELLTLIVAGHETTAAALSWTWYLLATHPDSFRQLQTAVRGLDPTRVPDWRTLERLPFVTQVIREALRLYPPGWLYTRRALAADRLGDYQVPAGTDLFICSWLLHRHPACWEQPEAFRPQRFAPDGEVQRGRGVYLPFSAGPRYCIGESFALAEMAIHLAVLARYVQPQAPDGPRPEAEADVNLRPRTPLSLTFSAADPGRG